MKINNMNSGMMMIHLRRGNWWWARDHTDERSVCRRRIAGVQGIRGLIFKGRTRRLKKVWITLGTISP
jgi:hypothetical protein